MTSKDVEFRFDVIGKKVAFGDNGGNGYSGGETLFHWRCERPDFQFKLTFWSVKFGGLPKSPNPWPFGEAPCEAPDSTGWVDTFDATPAREGAFKYKIQVRRRESRVIIAEDPMIIVGRV